MKPRGYITFVFDDGYEDVYRLVVPLLEKYGYRGVFALPLEKDSLEQETKQKIKPWSEWLSVTDKGHEIAGHSTHHVDLTKLLPYELEQELQQPAKELKATTLVYPGGAHNEAVVTATARFYTSARTVQSGFNTAPPTDPWELRSYNFSKNNFSVAKANLLALSAFLTNSWLIETYHLVTDHESDLLHSTVLADFEKHLRFVKQLPIAVKTIKELTSSL